MVLAHHVIFGMYGFWMPNDPRGSHSEFVGAWDLFRSAGRATAGRDTLEGLATEQPGRTDRAALKARLKYPPVRLTGEQAVAVAGGFAQAAQSMDLRIAACAIMPDHVHLVTVRHTMKIEQVVIRLKAEATRSLVRNQLHPLSRFQGEEARPPKCFARGEWKSFLGTETEIHSAVNYVRQNPIREGLKAQRWSFEYPV